MVQYTSYDNKENIKYAINDFLTKLSYEKWDITFSNDDYNIMFNA